LHAFLDATMAEGQRQEQSCRRHPLRRVALDGSDALLRRRASRNVEQCG
jgi:hypothetical protein